MDKVKFFAIFLPILIGFSFLFRVLIPIAVAAVVICIITMTLFNKKNSGFFRKFQSREPTKFVCIGCGFYHNENACPKCGSKIKKFYEFRK